MNSPDRERAEEYRPLSSAEVFDDNWEQRARKALAPTGWDSDLAIRVARDALRVISGEMTEDEFHARHRDGYLREFGVDDRPREDQQGAAAEPSALDSGSLPPGCLTPSAGHGAGHHAPPDAPEHAGMSRRSAIALAGGGLAALLLGDLLTSPAGAANGTSDGPAGASPGGRSPESAASSDDGSHKTGVRMGMVMDLEKCTGCLQCVAVCKREHALPDGVFWIYVMAFKEPDLPNTHLLVRTCQHCSNAPCVKVCPTGARHRRDDGLVLTNYEVCFGCRYCQVACPYGVNYFGWSESDTKFTGERRDARGVMVDGAPPRGVMGKCVFDPLRQDDARERGTTHCELACPEGVIHFGDLNDPESEPNRYLRQRLEESGGKLSTFRLLDDLGTRPNVIYIGHQPSRRAVPAENPSRYEDWGFVEERRIVLEGPEPWFKRVFGR